MSVLQAARLGILLSGLTAFLALSAAGAGLRSVLVVAALVAALGLARRTWRRWDARSRKCVLARDVAITNRRVMSWAWMAAALLPMALMTATLTLQTDWRGHGIAWYVSVPLSSLAAIASVQLVLARPKRLACPESDLLPAPRSEYLR